MLNIEPCTSFGKDASRIVEKVMDYCTPDYGRLLVFMMLNASILLEASRDSRTYCLSTRKGMTIAGANYKRIQNANYKMCENNCIEDLSCFGFEYDQTNDSCYLKSRSISGDLTQKDESSISFCIDETDTSRDRLYDHAISGHVTLVKENVANDNTCLDMCKSTGQGYYSWKPDRKMTVLEIAEFLKSEMMTTNRLEALENIEQLMYGTCSCLKTLTGIRLEYDAFSGMIPKHRRHQEHLRRRR